MQSIGARLYLRGRVKMSGQDVKLLKKWNNEYPCTVQDNDYAFLSKLLDVVFGRETIARSSAYGRPANNVGTTHDALDCETLKFVKGA